ncbi:MAG: hypothetical protein ABWY45_01615 [Mycobacterium sp.]
MKLWQRNTIGAAVSAAACAVIVVTDLWPDWATYRDSTHADNVVAVGAVGDADGQTWQVESIRHRNDVQGIGGRGLPDGTVLNVVTVQRTGSPTEVGCAGVITDGRRRWSAEGAGGYGDLPPEGITRICGTPGPVQFSFLLPGDVVPTAVDVTDAQGRILVRLLL